MANRNTTEIELKAIDNISNVLAKVEKALERFERAFSGTKKLKVEVDTRSLDSSIKSSQKLLKDSLSKTRIKIDVDKDSISAAAQKTLRQLSRELKQGVKVPVKVSTSEVSQKQNSTTRTRINPKEEAKNTEREVASITAPKIKVEAVLKEGTLNKLKRDIQKQLSDIKINVDAAVTKSTPQSTIPTVQTRRTTQSRQFSAAEVKDYFRSRQGLTTILGNTIQLSGRSSKGVGSAMEVVALLSRKLATLGSVAQTVGLVMSSVVAPLAIFGSGLSLAELAVGKLASAFDAMYDVVSKLVSPGIDLMNTMQSAQLSLGAGMRAVGTVNGRKLEREESKAYAEMLANRALLDAQSSAFNVQELITALQGTMPTLMNKGLDVQQAYDITKGVASVAKLTRLSANQVLQETRDLAQGTISSRSSQVANTLGITSDDIKQFQGDADGLYNYFMERFKSFSDEMKSYADTPAGAWERFTETMKMASMTLTENLAPAFAKLINEITNRIGHFEDAYGNKLDSEGYLVNNQGQYINSEQQVVDTPQLPDTQIHFVAAEEVQKLQELLEKLAPIIVATAESLYEMIGGAEGIDRVIKEGIPLFNDFVTVLLALGKGAAWLIGVLADVIRFIQKWWDALVVLGTVLLALVFPVRAVANAIRAFVLRLGGLIQRAIAAAGALGGFANMIKNVWSAIKSGNFSAVKDIVKQGFTGANATKAAGAGAAAYTISDNIDNLLFGRAEQKEQEGYWLSRYNRIFDEIINKPKNDNKNSISLTDVKGRKPSQDDKKAIQEAQKALQDALSALKEKLSEKLEEIKDQLKTNELKYKQGFMTAQEYYAQAAQAELDEAQLSLETAQKEREAILRAPYENDADKIKALNSNAVELRKATREMERAAKGVQDVVKVLQASNDTTAKYQARAIQATQAPNKTYATNEETAYRFLTSQGFSDNLAVGIIAAMKGESLNNPRDKHTDSNGLLSMGIAQWNGARRDALLQFAQDNNSDAYHIMTQLAFLVKELQTTEKDSFDRVVRDYNAGGQTAEAATAAFVRYFERPADIAGQSEYRKSFIPEIRSILMNASNSLSNSADTFKTSVGEFVGGAELYNVSNGELIGYRPEAQYSNNGLDTRFLDLDYLIGSEGVESIKGLQENVKMALNLLAKQYFEQTGRKLEPTSFTGGRHAGGEFSHSAGWKVDLANDTDAIVKELFERLGASIARESNHWDASFGLGGDYNGNPGRVFYEKQRAGSWQSPSQGGIVMSTDNYVEQQAYGYMQELMEARKKVEDTRASLEEDQYNSFNARFSKIQDNYLREYKELVGKFKDQPELLAEALDVLEKKTKVETDKLMSEVNSKRLRLATETQFSEKIGWGDVSHNEQFLNPEAYADTVIRNLNHVMEVDKDNPFNIGTIIEDRWNDYRNAQNGNRLQEAFDIRKEILGVYDQVNGMFDRWQSSFDTYFDQYSSWLSNNPDATSLQKERGGAEITARKNEFIFNLATTQLDYWNKQMEKVKELLASTEEEMDAISAKLKEQNLTQEERVELEKKLQELQTQRDMSKQIANSISLRQRELTYTKLQAEQLKDQKDALVELRRTAKQALEDGLVTFLTDGITQAENLGEALRNLFTGILKEIQQFSAKQLVGSLMNSMFPVKNIETTAQEQKYTGELYKDKFASGTNYLMSKGLNYSLNKQFLSAYNNPFNQPWATSQLNPNVPKPWERVDAFKPSGLLGDSTINTANQQVTSGNITVNSGTLTVNGATMTEQPMPAETITQATDTAGQGLMQFNANLGTATTSFSQLTTTLISLSASASNAANALGNINMSAGGGKGFATGGYIRGAGTGTSDSIPAMLSNGEFVIKAASVKKYGINFLNAVNNGDFSRIRARVPKFATGGAVDLARRGVSTGMSAFAGKIGTNVSTTNHLNVALVRDEQEGMKELLKSREGKRILLDFSRKYASMTTKF